MRKLLAIERWPITVKVPLLVAGLMIGIAVFFSQMLLSRLVSDQEASLRALTGAYLDGLSTALLQPVLRADVWESFDAVDRAQNHYAGINSRFVIVQLPNGRVLAASSPLRFPADSVLPPDILAHFPQADELEIDNASGRAWVSRALRTEGFSVGRILAEIDITELLKIRREVTLTLILANFGLTAVFVVFGYFASKRMLQPIDMLTSYVEHVREGNVEPIPWKRRRGVSIEFQRLFDRFNAMAQTLNERAVLASQLAEREKYAVLGRLASGMAHEVNNPLGGLFNALDTLRQHGGDRGVRESTIDLLHRGLIHIRNVVSAALVTYRQDTARRPIRRADIDDLRLLIENEVSVRNIILDWDNRIPETLPVPAGGVRQATLNILLNACAASPPGGRIALRATASDVALEIEVADDGAGLPEPLAIFLCTTSDVAPPTGDRLGLWIVRRLVSDDGGRIRVVRDLDHKTLIQLQWPFKKDERLTSNKYESAREDLLHVK